MERLQVSYVVASEKLQRVALPENSAAFSTNPNTTFGRTA